MWGERQFAHRGRIDDQALEQIDLNRVASEGYIFQVEMNFLARCAQLAIKQLPICFIDRKQGASKMGGREAKEGIRQLWRLAFTRVKLDNLIFILSRS